MHLGFKVSKNVNEMIDPKHFVILSCIKWQSNAVPNVKSNTNDWNLFFCQHLWFLPHQIIECDVSR